jgi:hypothetical protein
MEHYLKTLKKMKDNEELSDRIYKSLQILDYLIRELEIEIKTPPSSHRTGDGYSSKLKKLNDDVIKLKKRKTELMENIMTLV